MSEESPEVEALRMQRLVEVNAEGRALAESAPDDPRKAFEARHGRVWDTRQLGEDFDVLGFGAPFVVVVRKADGVKGSLEFNHHPRYYFNFEPHTP